ncbi:FAD/NAD(P)-binding protein [Pseudomonas sp. BW7P1]|uniref:FAD/NAD(P)-binding protein n=1 Tax=Pseudomonas TaxID=286 RepID=UPI0021AD579D|nr:FAD/NAD(P)-binding protein [Pseudomonas sp. BW7P1]UWI60399.1 FAD/NAD(P)-binding protein [Pseudomonas sp. BW7P1]
MKHLVIIGLGFSGAVTAIEFLNRAPAGSRLTIINRSGQMARGLAYGTDSPDHLLNVPAGNMSALVEQSDSFLEFCKQLDPGHHSGSFVSRQMYGAYLSQLLSRAKADSCVECESIVGEVNSIQADATGKGAIIKVDTGVCIAADKVILAFGNFPPATPAGLREVARSNLYIEDPWSADNWMVQKAAPRILLIGSGLTAVDTLISLRRTHLAAKVTLLSRRGLLPTSHREKMPAEGFETGIVAEILAAPATVLSYMRSIRREVARYPERWREVVAALRPVTSELWSRLSLVERRRFLRHVQPHWDVYRHRMAPQTFSIFQDEIAASTVTSIAGRILSANANDESIAVRIRIRGGVEVVESQFDQVINCTGPCTDIGKISDAFISYLSASSIITPDALGIGINVDENYAVMSESGERVEWLSYVGPMLKARFWEATAVPELRQHARALAIRVAESFARAEQG